MNCKCVKLLLALGASLALVAAPAAFGQAAAAAKAPAPPPVCPLANQTGTCTMLAPLAPLAPGVQPKFAYELPKPVFYNPDTLTNPLYDYYRIQSSPATVNLVAGAGGTFLGAAQMLPDPFNLAGPATLVPKVWLGLVGTGNPATRAPLYTELWGYNQLASGNAAAILPGATYPSMSFRATRGKPVKVEWINNLPDQHLFCKQPVNSNIPCAIDRTLMGTLVRTPATGFPAGTDTITNFGGPMQPDNAMVVHLHGGEIPPDSDGFAELWFGNPASAALYPATAYPTVPVAKSQFGATQNIDPFFDTSLTATNGIAIGNLIRPTGASAIYNYPMVQDAATIWYHDHALGKTRVNVAAGPAGYFYVQDPAVDTALWGAPIDAPAGYFFGNCTNGGILAGQCRDVPIVLQDRSFNADGSINFPNGLGQAPKNKNVNPLAPGVNPAVHPQWIPEYFGDSAVVNGVTWPKLTVSPTAYRLRLLDGSNARCYTLSLTAVVAKGGAAVVAPSFNVIGSDQGYLPTPVVAPTLTMCPGERYEVVVDFAGYPAGTIFNLTNTAGAPFPAGPTPQAANSPYQQLASMMQFQVGAGTATAKWAPPASWVTAVTPTVIAGGQALGFTYGATGVQTAPTAVAAKAGAAATRFLVLNEVLDPVSKQPLRVQIDGKPFEAPVTETPKRGTAEVWQFINTTVDAHPMHLHLVQFKVISRQAFDVNGYKKLNVVGFPPVVTKADPTPFLMGLARPPDPGEEGFKDTARALPGEVLTVIAKWDARWDDCAPGAAPSATCKQAPACTPYAGYTGPVIPAADPVTLLPNANPGCMCVPDALNPAICSQPVDPITLAVAPPTAVYKPYFQPVTAGPYVWHCHIVDHEDNEMMRPSLVIP